MGLISKLRKAGSLLGLALIGAGAGAVSIIGCAPEGTIVAAQTDGIITAEEEERIINRIATNDWVEHYDMDLRYFTLDIAQHAKDEMITRGYERSFIKNNLHIKFLEDTDAIQAKRDKLDLSSSGKGIGAFYWRPNNTIYQPQNTFMGAADTFFHEWGHTLPGGGSNEIAAEANELYCELKLANLSYKLAPLLLKKRDMLTHSKTIKEYKKETYSEYGLGMLTALYYFSRYGGGMETGLYFLYKRDEKKAIEEMIDAVGGEQTLVKDAYFDLYQRLFMFDSFRDSYPNLSDNEFEEFKLYLKMELLYIRLDSEENIANYKSNLEELVYDENFTNPYIQNIAALRLGYVYNWEAINAMAADEEWKFVPEKEREDHAWDVSKRILELNQHSPCEPHPIDCPDSMSEQRGEVISAFLRLLEIAYVSFDAKPKRALEAIAYAEDFFDRYYETNQKGNVDYSYDDEYYYRSFYAPDIARYIAELNVLLSDKARDEGHLHLEAIHHCDAIRWYERAAQTACYADPEGKYNESDEPCPHYWSDYDAEMVEILEDEAEINDIDCSS